MLCCLIDGTEVLYNKFNVDSSSPPDNPSQHPNSDYNCVVATTAQWRVSRCDQQQRVVCQSDTLIGIMAICLQQIICSRIQWLVLCLLGFYFLWTFLTRTLWQAVRGHSYVQLLN